MEFANLVILISMGTGEFRVIQAKNADKQGLTISPEKGVWSFEEIREAKIGEMVRRDWNFNSTEIVGIYDRMSNDHLNQMIMDIDSVRAEMSMNKYPGKI